VASGKAKMHLLSKVLLAAYVVGAAARASALQLHQEDPLVSWKKLGGDPDGRAIDFGAVETLEQMRNELLRGSSDCHTRTRVVLSSSASALDGQEQCQSECTKLSLALTLANCILEHSKQALIFCGETDISTAGCALREGCLTEPPAAKSRFVEFGKRVLGVGFGAGPGLIAKYPPPRQTFNTPTQQSIVFSEAYNHIDGVCMFLAQQSMLDSSVDISRATLESSAVTLQVIQDGQKQGLRSMELMTVLQGNVHEAIVVTVESMKLTSKTLEVSTEALDATLRSAAVLARTEGKLEDNMKLTQKVHETTVATESKVEEANRRLDDSIGFTIELLELAEKSLKMIFAITGCLTAAEQTARNLLRILMALFATIAAMVFIRGPVVWGVWIITVLLRGVAWTAKRSAGFLGFRHSKMPVQLECARHVSHNQLVVVPMNSRALPAAQNEDAPAANHAVPEDEVAPVDHNESGDDSPWDVEDNNGAFPELVVVDPVIRTQPRHCSRGQDAPRSILAEDLRSTQRTLEQQFETRIITALANQETRSALSQVKSFFNGCA